MKSATSTTATIAQTKTVRLEQFQTPTKNISCDASGQSVRCDIREMSWPAIAQPAGCPDEWDWGNGFTIEAGTASVNCGTDSVLNSGNPVLAYGEASTVGAITCVSRLPGLTCTHAGTKHGFFMSRDSYKLF